MIGEVLKEAMNKEVGISTNRGGEVCVEGKRETKVAAILCGINSFGH